jgi:anhydro-N-acetylmuramic acid kinase
LLEFTAATISKEINDLEIDNPQIFLCGGGANNCLLTNRLEELLHPHKVALTSILGIEPDWVEAAAFAWLAQQTLQHKTGNIPSVTGASDPAILGAIHPN